MAKVFVVQLPHRFDPETGKSKPYMDITPASAYGEIEFLLEPTEHVFNSGPIVKSLSKKLAKFSSEDFIVALGDPTAIGIAAAIAARNNRGLVNMLKWERKTGQYVKVEFDINMVF